jgi:chromosome segregation protein
MQAVEGQLLRLEEQLDEVRKSESETSDEVNALEEALKRQHALDEAQASADAAQENVRSQERVVEGYQVQLAQQDAKIVALQAEVSRLEARLDVLQQAEENLEGYSESARRMLEMLRRQHGGEGVGALSAQLKVPKQVEMAIAAALGLFLEAVVYPAEADLEDALAIVEQASGRVPVLPLGELAAERKLTPPKDADCLGVAADLVDCPPVLRPAVDLLLGRVLVVKDRSAARRLRRHADTTVTVTLHGEVFDRRGPVIAGGMGAGNPLSRSQERRRLAKKLSAAQDQLSQARQQKTQVEKKLETLLQSLEAAQAAWAQAQERLAQAEEEHRTLAQQLERARQRLAWKREQMEALEAERAEKGTAHSQYQTEVGELDAALEQLQAAIRGGEQRLESVNLQEFQDRVTQWEMRAAVAKKAVEEAESRLGEYQQAEAAAEEWKLGLDHQIRELDAELSSLMEGRAELRDRVVELEARIETLQNRICPMKQQLAEMEESLEKLYTEEEQARKRLTIGERHYTQAVSALTRKKEGLDNLRERVMDDFGLVAFEYAEEISGPRPLPLKGMVEKLPRVEALPRDLEETLKRKRAQLRRMGSIYPDAEQEYEEVRQRYEFLTGQLADLEKAEADVRAVITELDDLMQREFRSTFDEVARHFSETFTRLFGGGAARLLLTDPEDLTQTGVDIETRLPGKRPQRLALLSGGERSLTAAALVFSLLKVSPTPFCVLDEVDAMLDEFNLERFRELLEELSQETQFIVITHNRNTVRAADVIYGVSMGRDSTSQVISLRMGEVAEKAGI